MNVRINKQMMRLATDNATYADAVADAYNRSARADEVVLGETLMRENPSRPVAVVSRPIAAALGSMLYLQPYKGAEVPVWVAINAEQLDETHILALDGRDCYFYPTAGQYWQWVDCVGIYREILGNVAFVHDGLYLAHMFCPKVIKEDSDITSIVTLPFETSSLFMGYDDLEFYKRMDASLLKTGDLQK